MKEFIDKEIAIEGVRELFSLGEEWTDEFTIVGMLEKLQAVNIDKAHWIKVGGYATPGGDPVWKCSNCGKGVHVYGIEANSYQSDIADGQWITCPNCGAIMEEE